MDVTVEIEKEEGSRLDMTVSVPNLELETRAASVLARLREQIALPGFRKGHVPMAILEKRFGPQAKAEGLDDLLKEAVQEAFEQKKIVPVETPQLSDIQMDNGKIKFKVGVEIRQEVKLTDDQILRIPLPKSQAVVITDEDVTAAIDNERKSESSFAPELEVRPVRKGDFAVIDYEGFLKDKDAPIDGAKAENVIMEVGAGRFLPGFDDQIAGMSPGDRKRIDIVFPADFYDDDLKGKSAYFHVKVHAIKKRQMPELTDEFAKGHGYDSLQDMRAKIRAEMERGALEMGKDETRKLLFQALDERIKFDPPTSFVKRQAENLIKGIERQYKGGRKELLERLASEGKTESDFDSDMNDRARRQVKNSLILDAVSKMKNIHVTDEEVDRKIADLAEQNKTSPDVIRKELEKQERLEEVRYAMLDEKVVQFLIDHADIR